MGAFYIVRPDFQAEKRRNPGCCQSLHGPLGFLDVRLPAEDHKVLILRRQRCKRQLEPDIYAFLCDDSLQRFAGVLRKGVGLLGEGVKLAFGHLLIIFLQLQELLLDAFHRKK